MPITLDEIIENKRREIEAAKRIRSLDETIAAATGTSDGPRNFAGALAKPGISVIAEMKGKSPSSGFLREVDPAGLAARYEAAGASALSVLTDTTYFGGRLEWLRAARQASSLPTLRKDFMLDEYQVYEARAAGADAILVIMAVLDDTVVARLLAAAEATGMAALVECHTAEDVGRVPEDVRIYGINNRTLSGGFGTDLAVTERLAPSVPEGRLMVSESGIAGPEDVARLAATGRLDAILVGTSILRGDDPATAVAGLVDAGGTR